jgi:hypothetical protein
MPTVNEVSAELLVSNLCTLRLKIDHDALRRLQSSTATYLELLQALLDCYVIPITGAYRSNAVAAALAADLGGIIAHTQGLVRELGLAKGAERTAEVFCELSSTALHAHIGYADRYHAAMGLLDMVDAPFMHKLDAEAGTLARCKGLSVDELIMAPLDAPAMFLGYFTQLAVVTPWDHPDREHAERAGL